MKELWFWGIVCGLAGLGGSMLQQIGIVTVTAGKTSFITGMFVIFVPIVEWLTPGFGVTLTARSWYAAMISMMGLFLLSGCAESSDCMSGSVGTGEVVVFVSMLFWVGSIMASDVGAKKVDTLSLTTVDFFVTTIFTVLFAMLFESEYWRYPFTAIRVNWGVIVAVGFTEAVAFALSTLGQMYTPPTRASVLFSMEAVLCSLLSYLFIHEQMTYIEVLGCGLMFGSAVFSSFATGHVDEGEEDQDRLATNDEESVRSTKKKKGDNGVELVPILNTSLDQRMSFGSMEHYKAASDSRGTGLNEEQQHRAVPYSLLNDRRNDK